MMTIVTHITVEPGQEPAWDATFRERVEEAKQQPGWVGVQLCIPLDAPNKRVIIGTWQTRADWEAWHANSKFQQTRKEMDTTKSETREEWWHEVIVQEHR